MQVRHSHTIAHYLVQLALLVALFFVIGLFDMPQRAAFDSHEVRFTDSSRGGLAIMPASCASNPGYYHSNLTVQGAGYSIASGQSEYGAHKNGLYLCVTNTSGVTYFIPANNAVEMNSFRSAASGGTGGYGGTNQTINGGPGGEKSLWQGVGPGAGAGGGGRLTNAGAAGLYGAGGGGGGETDAAHVPTVGAQGLIVVTYTPSAGIPQSTVLTSGSSWTVPSNWNNADNIIRVIGGGGGGGNAKKPPGNYGAGGGGGGAYSRRSNLTLTPGSSVSYSIGASGSISTVGGGASGGAGGDTWFNGASCAGASVCAKGGSGGTGAAAGGTPAGGTGGQAASGVGDVRYSGGNGGNGGGSSNGGGGGGGGAGGPSGNGGNGGAGDSSGGGGGGGAANGGAAGSAASGGTGGNGGAGVSSLPGVQAW